MHFLNPIYLWALTGVSLPILIHLFSRKKGKPILFPSIKFLKIANSISGRRKKVEDIIILVVRMLLLFFLLLILSNPVFKVSSPFSEEGYILFLIDDSYSMNAIDVNNPSEKYKTLLLETLSYIRRPARVALVYLSGDTYPFTHNYSEAISVIKRKDISFQSGNLSVSLEESLKLLEKEKGDKVICFFTDLQKLVWKDVNIPNFGKKNIKFLLFDIGQANTNNVSFKKVYHIPGTSDIILELQNWGKEDVTVEVILNGEGWERRKNVSLKSESLEVVNLNTPDVAGMLTVSINNTDILQTDNIYYASFIEESNEKILIVGEQEESFYIQKALQVVSGEKIEIVRVAPQNMKDVFLESFLAIFISNNGVFPEGLTEKIYRYVDNGGNVACFPGSRVVPATFNQNWQPVNIGIPFFMPAKLKSIKSFPKTVRVGESDSFHPLFISLKGVVQQYTKTVIFRQVFSLTDITGDTLLNTSEGTPLIIEKKVGKGRILLFSFPVDDKWTNIHFKPFFPVLVNNILEHFSGVKTDNFIVGVKNNIRVPYGVETVYLYTPDGEKSVLKKDSSEEVGFTPQGPGFWILEFAKGKNSIKKIIPVNLDATESDLTRIDATEITNKLGRANITFVKKEKIREFLSKRGRTKGISEGLLNIVLILFLLELLLIKIFRKIRKGKNV